MGDSASKVISAQEALPGRPEPIPVAGKTARALGMRAEPAHCALPEEAARGLGRVPGRGLRVRAAAARPPPQAPLPPSHVREGWALSEGSLLSQCFSLFESLRTKQGALKESSVGIWPSWAAGLQLRI